jgi:hypothetical protein
MRCALKNDAFSAMVRRMISAQRAGRSLQRGEGSFARPPRRGCARDLRVAERAQHADTACAQEELLTESMACLAAVQLVGQAPVVTIVPGNVRVEKVHGNARASDSADEIAPRAHHDAVARHVHRTDGVSGLPGGRGSTR